METKKLTVRKLFDYEVQKERGKYKDKQLDCFTEEEISKLPEPVRRYFNYCNYIGKEKKTEVKLIFEDVNFKLGVDKPSIKIKYEQYNFAIDPVRLAYIHTRMFGIIPFEGRDKYQDGKGNMIGRLLKKLTLFNVSGEEINISAAVTFLAEILILPSCALQQYIRWEAIDNNHARAIIDYKGIEASGIYTFNEKGEFIKFQTEERYLYANGKSDKHKWTAEASDYIEKNGIKIPSRIKGVWNLPSGDFEYFDGKLIEVK